MREREPKREEKERKKEQQGYSLVVKWPDGGGQVYSGDRDRDRDTERVVTRS